MLPVLLVSRRHERTGRSITCDGRLEFSVVVPLRDLRPRSLRYLRARRRSPFASFRSCSRHALPRWNLDRSRIPGGRDPEPDPHTRGAGRVSGRAWTNLARMHLLVVRTLERVSTACRADDQHPLAAARGRDSHARAPQPAPTAPPRHTGQTALTRIV